MQEYMYDSYTSTVGIEQGMVVPIQEPQSVEANQGLVHHTRKAGSSHLSLSRCLRCALLLCNMVLP